MKVWGSEATSFAMDEAVQIHGGYGYIQEYPVERGYRDARINRIFEGTNEINRMLIPGTLLKRSMKGQVPLMPFVAKIQKALKDPSAMPKKPETGALATEAYAVELARRAVAFACGSAIRKHLTKLGQPEQQMVLIAMADLIMEVYALDSAVSRTLQTIEAQGDKSSRIPIAATKVYVAEAIDKLRTISNRLLSNCLEGVELDDGLAALQELLPYVPLSTFTLKDEIAAHLLEREIYSLE